MTSIASHGFEELTEEAFKAGALSTWVNKALRWTLGSVFRLALVPALARSLERIVARLRQGLLEELSEPQLEQMTVLLVDLHGLLERTLNHAAQRRIRWFSGNAGNYRRIALATEDLADFVEAASLSLNPAFRTRVDAAIRELHV